MSDKVYGTKRQYEVTLLVRISADTHGEALSILQERVEAGGPARDRHCAQVREFAKVHELRR